MTPILYEKDEIDFTSQGLGSLVEIYDVDVQEQRNGLLQLTASYPISGLRYADISVGRIILAKPNQRDNVHAFRIVNTELDISGYAVTIEADSITYDLTHNLVKHLVASGNGQSFMTALKNAVVNPSIFAFYSDIATSSTTSLDYVNPMEAIMGTTGSFLQIWGGELKRENRRVAMFNRRGRDNVATFRLGKNISGLKYSVDISSLVTRIIPTKSIQNDDQTTTTLEGTPVDSQYINNYEQIYTLPLEFTDDAIKTVADLNTAAKGWFTKSANTGRDKPTVTIDIDVLSLQDSADYQDKFKNLESVSLTDTVTVYVPEYGVNVTAIVNELHYDPILDRVTKMTVGTAKQSFADSSKTQLSDLQDKIISVQNQADATAVSANGKSTNYYGSVEPSHPQEGDTWFWVNGDKSGIKQFVNGDWVDLVDSDTQEKIAASVTDAVTQAKTHVEEVKQGILSDIDTAKSQAVEAADLKAKEHVEEVKQVLSTDIATAKSQAVSLANTAQQNAIDVASKSLGTYLVRLLPGTNIFKTTNSTTIQAQVWKAGQDITSTLDSASFSWKIAKDGAAAISLTNNVKNVTAKPSDFNSTGTYIVNVIIPVTDTTGTTRNQTFSDSTTIAKVTDGVDGTDGKNGATGNGISSTIITYAVSASGTNAPTSGYTSTIPTVNKGQFLWQRTTTSYTNGTTKNSDVVTYFAKDGLNGIDGGQGMIAQPTKPASDLIDGFLWLDTSQTYPVYYVYDSSIKDFKIYQFNAKNINADQIKAKFVGTDRLSASEIIADDLHVKSANIDGKMTASQITVSSTNGAQTSLANFNLGEMSQTISDTKNAVNSLGQINQLFNTEFSPDFQSWTQVSDAYYTNGNNRNGSTVVKVARADGDYLYQDVAVNRGVVSFSSLMEIDPGFDGAFRFAINFRDSNHDYVPAGGTAWSPNNTSGMGYTLQKVENIAVPDGSAYVRINYGFSGTGVARFLQPMLVFSDQVGAYVQGNYNNNAALAQVKITADGISNFVRDPSGNISSEFQTALGKVSIVSDSNFATSIKTQTATQISSALTDNNGKIISLINQDSSGVQIAGKNITLDGNTTFTALQQTINNLGQVNKLMNTEFSPDFQSWTQVSDAYYTNGNNRNGSTVVKVARADGDYLYQDVAVNRGVVSFSSLMEIDPDFDGDFRFAINFRDSTHALVSGSNTYWSPNNTSGIGYTLQKVENIAVPDGSAYVRINYRFRGTGVARFAQPMLVFESTVGSYVQGNYNNNVALAQVKVTAEGISNFVKDDNGNLSSTFQTALGKVSIVSDSNFATSIKTQTATQISSALTDNNGKIISLINQDSSGVQIAGKNITLDGNTTVTGDFYAKGGNFKNLNASNLTVGTLNGNQVNITNLNASNIVSGAISGANLNINLNTGSVVFQKGRINSSDYTTDINIDQGYISTANDNTRALIKQGMIQLVAPNSFDLQTSPYMEISNNRGQSTAGAAIIGRDSVSIANSKNAKNIFPAPIGTESFSGFYTGQAFDGGWLPTKVSGADRGVVIAGGTETSWQVLNTSPYIWVGSNATGSSGYGNRVVIKAEYLHATTVYNHGGSTAANVYVASDGALLKSSSATKYKTNIEHETDSVQGDQLLTIDPATWNDKFESEQLEYYHETGVEPERQINMEGKRYYGIIAEDLVKAGLEELVTRNEETDEVEGVEYSKIGVALIPIVRDLRNKLNEQAVEIERLKDKNK